MSEARDEVTYARKLTECATLDELRALMASYSDLAIDAVPIVAAMTEADFPEFRRGLKSERKGRFAGEAWMERFGSVLMPMPMLRISMLSEQFKAPFAVTHRRLKELRPDLFTNAPAPPPRR